jgi:hypothetical protein
LAVYLKYWEVKSTPSLHQEFHCWLPKSITATRCGIVGTRATAELWLWSTSINNSFLAYDGVVIKYQYHVKITSFLKFQVLYIAHSPPHSLVWLGCWINVRTMHHARHVQRVVPKEDQLSNSGKVYWVISI